MSDEEIALAWLKARVQDMSDQQPMWSRSAYTHRRTPHAAFVNGQKKEEGEFGPPWRGNVRDVTEATLMAVRAYRESIDGPVLLTWRQEPVVEEDAMGRKRVYCRLSFEPDNWA